MNKKNANIMATVIVKVILLLLCFFFLFSASCKLYASLTYNPQEDMMKDQLDIFASQINSLASSDQEYTAIPVFLNILDNRNTIVAFDSSGRTDVSFSSAGFKFIARPSQCKDKSCICLYEAYPNFKKPIYCSNLDVNYILASNLMHRFPKNYGGDSGLFFSNEYQKNNLISTLRNKYSADVSQTSDLGFDSDKFYYFVLANSPLGKGISYASIYAEIINISDYKILLLHPYSSSLNNRKYYLVKSKGIDKCNEGYIHLVINKGNGNYTYCKMGSQGLQESTVMIQKCKVNKSINTTCVCGKRAVSSGYCFEDNNKRKLGDNGQFYCSEFSSNFGCANRCLIYSSEYSCLNDLCAYSCTCEWLDTGVYQTSPGCYEK